MLQTLQQNYGNGYVQRLVNYVQSQRTPTIQTKLRVGAAGDTSEQEADRIAKDVVRGLGMSGSERDPNAVEAHSVEQADRIGRAPSLPVGMEGGEVDPDTEELIAKSRGGGQPLPDAVRTPMEGAFGADFGNVRIHTDGDADSLNASVSARAFTTGQDIFFSEGEYKPGSSKGDEVLAHELTHVVQQGGAGVRRTPSQDGQNVHHHTRANARQGRVVSKFRVSAMLPSSEGSDLAQGHGREPANGTAMRMRSADSAAGGETVTAREEEPGMASLTVSDKIFTSIPYKPTITETPTPPGPNEFGLTNWTARVTGLSAERDDTMNGFLVTADVECPITWSVHDLGKADADSATAPSITADNYGLASSDLTPNMASDGGRPPRTSFWASDLTEQHEKYHANDFAYTYGNPAFAAAITWLKAQEVASIEEAKTQTNLLPRRMTENLIANYVPGSETRAYGDGAALYKGRADSIKEKGDKGDYTS
jgi:hypothetical protein